MSLRGRGYPADRRWRACRSRGTSKEEWGSRRPVRHLRERQSRSNDGVIGVIAARGRLRRRLAQVQEGLQSVPVGCISKARALSSRSLRRSSEPRQAIKGTQHGQPQRRSQRHARRTRPRLPATSVSSGLRTSTTKMTDFQTVTLGGRVICGGQVGGYVWPSGGRRSRRRGELIFTGSGRVAGRGYDGRELLGGRVDYCISAPTEYVVFPRH